MPLSRLNNLQRISIGAAFALFALVDLVTLLFVPVPRDARLSYFAPMLIVAVVSVVIALVALPPIIRLFERQQERIERQQREIATLHALDAAISTESDLNTVLQIAVREAIYALDAEAGGIVVLADHESGPETTVEATAFRGLSPEEQTCLLTVLRTGPVTPEVAVRWEIARLTLQRSGGGGNADRPLGALAVVRARPTRPFSAADRDALSAIAEPIIAALLNARALAAAHLADGVREELARERTVAHALQEGLLPEVPACVGDWHFSKCYAAQSPEAQVGGDIYDVFPLAGGTWGVVIADVSGKGLTAARKTALVKYALRAYAREHAAPDAVVQRLNTALYADPEMTGFISLFYGVLHENDGRLTYACAGHEPPLLRRANGQFERLMPTGPVIGADDGLTFCAETAVLQPGDGVLLYTDGLSEARTPDGAFLDTEGVQRLLTERCGHAPAKMADMILEDARRFAGGVLRDDAALLWIERAVPCVS